MPAKRLEMYHVHGPTGNDHAYNGLRTRTLYLLIVAEAATSLANFSIDKPIEAIGSMQSSQVSKLPETSLEVMYNMLPASSVSSTVAGGKSHSKQEKKLHLCTANVPTTSAASSYSIASASLNIGGGSSDAETTTTHEGAAANKKKRNKKKK
ncbi:unnamed protein product [Protopolystoma xenopodis]|uniref:Uncharacterized protein n=1 Tax=Protopolystoma xenopodis TaxID=117903 RepID=A0A448WNG5_9PLAT|nr:unnamed protein product [Protopolystoma xenopodis]